MLEEMIELGPGEIIETENKRETFNSLSFRVFLLQPLSLNQNSLFDLRQGTLLL